MSMTLILWKAPVVADADDARALLQPYYDREDDSAFEPCSDLAAVRAQLLEIYPDPSAEPDSPWADFPPEETDRLLLLSIRWSADDRILADIVALARKFGLVLYDPQGPDVFLPDDPVEAPAPDRLPTALERIGSVALAAILVGLAYAAWLIPVAWLRWPAVIVAGFFAAAGLIVAGAMIFARQIMNDPSRSPTQGVSDA